MIDKISESKIMDLIGPSLFDVWQGLTSEINKKYEMDCTWNSGGKAWTYEYKYRRGGRTLCALYAKENHIGFLIIFGKDERLKFEADKDSYPKTIQKIYDDSKTYHDGKWMMFELQNASLFHDFMRLLRIKRRPNKK